MSNPTEALRGKVQQMTLPDGTAKGLKRVLEERGFNVEKLRAKCSPVCPIGSQNCCMARLLSQQEDFKNQPSMLEMFFKSHGYECIFLPKFHCELNPIEMVSLINSVFQDDFNILCFSTGDGASTGTGRKTRKAMQMPRRLPANGSMHVQRTSSTKLGVSWMRTERV